MPYPECGKEGVSRLDAHHIDGNRNNTVESNLIMLCKTCHDERPSSTDQSRHGDLLEAIADARPSPLPG